MITYLLDRILKRCRYCHGDGQSGGCFSCPPCNGTGKHGNT